MSKGQSQYVFALKLILKNLLFNIPSGAFTPQLKLSYCQPTLNASTLELEPLQSNRLELILFLWGSLPAVYTFSSRHFERAPQAHGHKPPRAHGHTAHAPPRAITGTRAHEHTPPPHGHTGREVMGEPIMIYGKQNSIVRRKFYYNTRFRAQ